MGHHTHRRLLLDERPHRRDVDGLSLSPLNGVQHERTRQAVRGEALLQHAQNGQLEETARRKGRGEGERVRTRRSEYSSCMALANQAIRSHPTHLVLPLPVGLATQTESREWYRL